MTFGPPTINIDQLTVTANIDQPNSQTLLQGQEMDAIICTFVFGHVQSPFAAAQNLYHWLKPGGVLFFTVNLHSPAPRIPQAHAFDNFRMTVDGAQVLLEQAGFEVLHQQLGGDPMTTTAFLMGWGAFDFAQQDIQTNAGVHEATVSTVPHLPGNGVYHTSIIIARKPVRIRQA